MNPIVILLAKATIILVLALGMTVVMQRASAGARHLVWLVTVAALLIVPALSAWAPLSVKILPPTPTLANGSSSLTAPTLGKGVAEFANQPAIQRTPGIPNAAGEATPTSSIGDELSQSSLVSGIPMLLFIWGAVVLVIGASLVYSALVVRRIVKRARPLDTQDWLTPLWEVSDRLALDEPPRLLRSADAKMPFACGLFTATIVLPAECDAWSLDRRRAVLLHELAHVRRHDLVGHTLGRLACAVYWFHPLVWTAAKRLRSESERACDDLALACGAHAADYAEHLLDIVTSVRRDATPSMALAMARRKEFEGRMLAILDPELRHSSPSRRQSASLIGSLALISIVVGAAAPAPRTVQPIAPPTAMEPAKGNVPASMHPDAPRTAPSTASDVAKSNASANTNRQALVEMLTQGNALKTEQGDERPALLAKILTTDSSASLRRIAAWGLAEYADKQIAAEGLATALRKDTNASVREMAAWALAEANRSAAAVDALIAALRGDANVHVRATSAWALGNVGNESAAEALAKALSDSSADVRKRAAWALGNADLKHAPPALIALLRDKDSEMRELAAWALFQLEDPASIKALEAALRSETDKNLQIAYIRALAAVGEQSVDALKSLLESRDPEIKVMAVRALAGGNASGPWPWPWPEPRPFP